MTFDIDEFRTNYPDFESETTYPDSMLTYWGSCGEILHSYSVFREAYQMVLDLYVAHKAILQAESVAGSQNNAVPIQNAGAVTGVTIGSVTTSYAGSAVSMNKATPSTGDFVETMYGRQYLNLLNMYCAGPIQR